MLCVSGLLCKRAKRRIRRVHRASCKADGSLVEVLFPWWYPINEFYCENGNLVWKRQSHAYYFPKWIESVSVKIFCCFVTEFFSENVVLHTILGSVSCFFP